MIWLIWRQYRVASVIGLLLLVILLITILHSPVRIKPPFDLWYANGSMICICLSFLVGMFLGAPLVAKELEQRTHYFLWTQSITRKRWLAVKLGLLAGTTLLAFGALMLVTAWKNAPINTMRSPWQMYEGQGIMPIGYALFGLMFGVAMGTFLRQTIPAMMLTFITFTFLLLALHNVYPYLVPPVSKTFALNANSGDIRSYMQSYYSPFLPDFSSNLILSSKFTNQQGKEMIDLTSYCGFISTASDQQACINKARADNLHFMVIYQPAKRFWLIQGIETSILLVMAGALIPLIFWGIRKQVS